MAFISPLTHYYLRLAVKRFFNLYLNATVSKVIVSGIFDLRFPLNTFCLQALVAVFKLKN
jgi:hypothetical protein